MTARSPMNLLADEEDNEERLRDDDDPRPSPYEESCCSGECRLLLS